MKHLIPVLGATVTLALSLTVTAAAPSPATAARMTCHGRGATIVGTNGDDELSGTRRADVIVGLGGNDVIRDRGGDDIVCGGPGNDQLGARYGYGGDDKFYGGAGNDRLVGGPGHNLLWGGPGDDLVVSAWHVGRNTYWGGPGDDNFSAVNPDEDAYGGRGNDSFTARVKPGSGHVLIGGSGANTLVLFPRRSAHRQIWGHLLVNLNTGRLVADDVVSRPFGQFTTLYLNANAAESYTVVGTSQADRLISGIHHHEVIERGRAGDDALYTLSGDDTLNGGPGTDQGHAGGGQDTCVSIEEPFVGPPAQPGQPIGCETQTP